MQSKVCEIDAYKQCLTNAFLTSSQGAAAMPGGDSEVKDIPIAECVAYGVGEVQQRMEDEDEGVYEPIPK